MLQMNKTYEKSIRKKGNWNWSEAKTVVRRFVKNSCFILSRNRFRISAVIWETEAQTHKKYVTVLDPNTRRTSARKQNKTRDGQQQHQQQQRQQ